MRCPPPVNGQKSQTQDFKTTSTNQIIVRVHNIVPRHGDRGIAQAHSSG